MPDASPIALVEHHLLQLGCSAAQVRRKIRELGDHHDDLKHDALEEGLSEADAEARADELLGEPIDLAQHLAAVLRQSSWWGRHPIVGFCLLPPAAILPASALLLLLLCGGFCLTNFLPMTHISIEDMGHAAKLDPGGFQRLFWLANKTMNCATPAMLALIFCWLARRSASGAKWVIGAAAMCSLSALIGWSNIRPGLVSFGYAITWNWIGAALPLLVGAGILIRQRRLLARPTALPAQSGNSSAVRRNVSSGPALPKTGYVTPTSVIGTLLFLCFMALLGIEFAVLRAQADNHHHREMLKSTVWPAERAALMEKVHSRQLASDAVNAIPIDLSAFVNAGLNDSITSGNGGPGDNLAELPPGPGIYAGVPFDVQGRLQLMGRGFENRVFPSRAKNIPIARKCAKIHLLHGACFVQLDEDNSAPKIARLILHYADGSAQEIDILAGEHVLNWKGPTYASDAGANNYAVASGTELAWIGSNAELKEKHSQSSLRLYKSTFANPMPELEITAIDYVSTLTQAAPFLLGLTAE